MRILHLVNTDSYYLPFVISHERSIHPRIRHPLEFARPPTVASYSCHRIRSKRWIRFPSPTTSLRSQRSHHPHSHRIRHNHYL
jgi:hypothetical protein